MKFPIWARWIVALCAIIGGASTIDLDTSRHNDCIVDCGSDMTGDLPLLHNVKESNHGYNPRPVQAITPVHR